jgi:hypothetical protein
MLLATNIIDDGSKLYTKQIHVYSGKVYAEIIYQNKETEWDRATKIWVCSLHKSFGPYFIGDSVREKDLIAAHKWADEQLALINKYCTNKLSKAQHIR